MVLNPTKAGSPFIETVKIKIRFRLRTLLTKSFPDAQYAIIMNLF